MDKKKFCFISSFHRDNNEVVMYRQASSLIINGFDVYYLVSDDKQEETIEEVKLIPSGFTPKGYIKRIFLAPSKAFKKAIEIDADIYQTSSLDFLFIMLLLKLKGKKIIFSLRESHPYTIRENKFIPKFFKSPFIFLLSFWMKYSLRLFNAVFTVSDDIVNYLHKWKIKRVYLLGNFPVVNKEYFLSYEEYISRENRILYFGLIYDISRQEIFLDALSKFDNVDYLIAGLFNNNEYRDNIEKNDKWKDVEFINGFRKSQLIEFINRSTISNVLRDFSNLGSPNGSMGIIKIFESMEAALPIICSDVPVYRDMMKKYKCGVLVDPNNSKQIEDAIRLLTTDKKLAYEMGQNGRKAVIEEYSWDAKSILYLDVINGILNK